eukprot:GEMP01015258.1.p1 GENE.GEMP01015258.1~~GEMP01015258.1.p1  ORF type:complete len:572 (+),score=99.13 GEMP01015258.1:139-1854(+)
MAVELVAHGAAPFSLPFECLTYKPGPETLVRVFKNNDSERCIHGHVALLAHEEELLAKFDKYCESRSIEFSPILSSKSTRYISRTRGKIAQAVSKMQSTEKWRKATLGKPLRDDDPELLASLSSGAIYFGGRDKFLRPLVVMVAKRFPAQWFKKGGQDQILRVVIFMMEYLQRYMIFPGNVENLCVLVDMDGMSLMQTPVSALKHIVGVLSSHYMGRLYKIYILQCPALISMTYSLMKNFITDRQQQKLDFLSANDLSHLTQLFHPQQLEKTYGGLRGNLVAPFYPFQFPPGPFDTSAKVSSGSLIPDAHIIMSEEMVFGGLIWRSHKTSCPEKKLLCDTARQREILSLANLLPMGWQCDQNGEPPSALRESAGTANGGDRKTEERYSQASSSTVANSTATQPPVLGVNTLVVPTSSDASAVIALEGASTIPEVGSIASDRSLVEANDSQLDANESAYANESTTLGSERHNELAALKSVGDTISNVSLVDGGTSEHSRRPLTMAAHVPAHIPADGRQATAQVPRLPGVTESECVEDPREVQLAVEPPSGELETSPRPKLAAPLRKSWFCSC